MSEESKKEIKQLLNSRSYYVSVSGEMPFSASTDINELVLANMTS